MGQTKTKNKTGRSTALLIIFAITTISVMGTASISPAFPEFRDYFHLTGSQVALLITVFTIPGIILIPMTGWLADKYGRKTILIPALLLFGLAGGACFFAPSFTVLLILRFVQGLGSAPLNSLNNTLITDFFKGERRIAILGYNGGVLSISTAVYPAAGGGLALLGWNFPFLLPLLAIPFTFLVFHFIPEPSYSKDPFDSKGYFKTLKQSTNKDVYIILLTVLLSFIILYGVYITFFPFLMDVKFGFNSATVGGLMAAMSSGAAFISFRIGKRAHKINLSRSLQFSFFLYTLGCLGMVWSPNVFWLLLSIIIFGLAQGLFEVCSLSYLSFLAPGGLRGMFMSLNGTMILVGQTIGPVLMGWFVGQAGLRQMFYIAAGFTLFAFFLLFIWKPQTKD